MTDEWAPPETWLVVLEEDNAATHIDPADEGAIDAAVSRYVDSGGTRDEVLCLTLIEGGRYHAKASRITNWWLRTPQHVRRNLLRKSSERESDRALRASLGLPWKEDE